MGFLGMFFMAGALLLIFLTLLGGVTNTHPLNIIYFLQARTNTIPGAPAVSRWTFWNICRVDERGKSRCGPSHVDFPFDPPSHRNFNTTVNVPREFIGYVRSKRAELDEIVGRSSNQAPSQNASLLPDLAIYFPIHHYWFILCRMLIRRRTALPVHTHWRLHVCTFGLGCIDLPNTQHNVDDVGPTYVESLMTEYES